MEQKKKSHAERVAELLGLSGHVMSEWALQNLNAAASYQLQALLDAEERRLDELDPQPTIRERVETATEKAHRLARCARCNHTREDHEDSLSGSCNYSQEASRPMGVTLNGVVLEFQNSPDMIVPCRCDFFVEPGGESPAGNRAADHRRPWKDLRFSIPVCVEAHARNFVGRRFSEIPVHVEAPHMEILTDG